MYKWGTFKVQGRKKLARHVIQPVRGWSRLEPSSPDSVCPALYPQGSACLRLGLLLWGGRSLGSEGPQADGPSGGMEGSLRTVSWLMAVWGPQLPRQEAGSIWGPGIQFGQAWRSSFSACGCDSELRAGASSAGGGGRTVRWSQSRVDEGDGVQCGKGSDVCTGISSRCRREEEECGEKHGKRRGWLAVGGDRGRRGETTQGGACSQGWRLLSA